MAIVIGRYSAFAELKDSVGTVSSYQSVSDRSPFKVRVRDSSCLFKFMSEPSNHMLHTFPGYTLT